MFVSILVFRVARLHSAALPGSQGSPAVWLLRGPLITRSRNSPVSSSLLLVGKIRSSWAPFLKYGAIHCIPAPGPPLAAPAPRFEPGPMA